MKKHLTRLAAILAIAAIMVGVPTLLILLGANPFSGYGSMREFLSAFTMADDGRLILAVIKLVAWIAWVYAVIVLMIETAHAVADLRRPSRGMPQLPKTLPNRVAYRLVAAAMGVAVLAPSLTSVASAAPADMAPQAPAVVAVQQQTAPVTDVAPAPATEQAPTVQTRNHTVIHGDTLWALAEQNLGDGAKYTQILELNHDVLGDQADFLTPGQVLKIPVGAGNNNPAPTTSTPGMVRVAAGESLSQIVERETGSLDQLDAVIAATTAIIQDDGTHLTDPDLIRPGWNIAIPGKTIPAPAAEAPASAAAPETAPDATPAPAVKETPAQTETTQPRPPQAAPDTTAAQPAAVAESPVAAETTPAAPSTHETADQLAAPAANDKQSLFDADNPWLVRTGAGVGALLAAGIIGTIITRRKRQQALRRPGQAMPLPDPTIADIEQEWRATADALSSTTIDTALRDLARHCTATSTPLPPVRAARLTATSFELFLEQPATLPTPWTSTENNTVWILDAELALDIDPDTVTDQPAPYPALVTLGHDSDNGHILINLEHLGSLALTGTPDDTRAALIALTVELATSSWADDLQVTLVGAAAGLEDCLQSGRIKYMPALGRYLSDLEHRAAADRNAMVVDGVDDLYQARTCGAAADAWHPEILVLAGPVSDQERDQLTRLTQSKPRTAIAAITADVPALDVWELALTSGQEGQAVLAPIGLPLTAQLVTKEQYSALLEVTSITDDEELLINQPEITDPSIDEVEQAREHPAQLDDLDTLGFDPVTLAVASPAPAVQEPAPAWLDNDTTEDVHDDAQDTLIPAIDAAPAPVATPADDAQLAQILRFPGPRILMLGDVELAGVHGPVDQSKKARLLELGAFLAVNPGSTYLAIDDAIWPDRDATKTETCNNTRNTMMSKLRRWLGQDDEGNDYLPRHASDGYQFSSQVTSDIAQWDRLIEHDPANQPTAALAAALKLVRGNPFANVHPRRYAWAENLRQTLTAEIVDVAYELARRQLLAGKWADAEATIQQGLRIVPTQEALWRIRILAAHQSGDTAETQEAIDRLLVLTEQLDLELTRETSTLIDDITNPASRYGHAAIR